LGRLGVEIRALRGFGAEEGSLFDRFDEQVDHLLASIDAAANGMGMLLDLQLNQRAYLVSVVATIFVPLTSITGFFGMNFGWMVDRVEGPAAFVLLGASPPDRRDGAGLAAPRAPVPQRRGTERAAPLSASKRRRRPVTGRRRSPRRVRRRRQAARSAV
jgi:hypothetical protein